MTLSIALRSTVLGVAGLLLLSGCNNSAATSQAKAAKAECCEAPLTAETPATAPSAAPTPKYASFGAPPKLTEADSLPVEKVLANPTEYKDKFVRLTGTVEKVCPNKGCWLTLRGPGNDEALFVKFQDPPTGRLIPMNAVGKAAIVEGVVRVRDIPEEVAKHYAEESGATPDQLAKIVGPQKQITVASPGAQVADVKNEQASPSQQ